MEDEKAKSILDKSLDLIMSDRFGRYSKYIIQGRALPDVRDGLKPVQRRILFSMQELHLTHDKAFKKSARVVGDVIGKYHPHGDSSIYEAMVRMSQDWKTNYPLVEMHGNNGSIDDDPAAAMRYTEARLSEISSFLINGIKQNTVAFAPNFDDTEKEPTVLPGLIPNLLINGARGIAAGYATEMPPHNLKEIVNAIIAKIKKPTINLKGILKHVKGPDFPTGGTVIGADGIYKAFERGRGKIAIRSKYEINDSKTHPSITITEIPFGVIKSKLAYQIDEIRFKKSISGISEVRDDSGRDGISIYVGITPGINPKDVLNLLLSKTDMQIWYNYNNIAIKDQRPIQLSILDLIDSYLSHQKEVQTKLINFNLQKDLKRKEIIEGLIKVADNYNKVIDVIRNAKDSRQGVIKELINQFNFTEIQASAIADLKLYRLSRQDQETYKKEVAELNETINKYKVLLSDDIAFDKYLIELLEELKIKFGSERKSVIQDEIEKIEIDMQSLIKHEDIWVSVSKEGYIKRFSNRVKEANNMADFGLKPNDSIIFIDKINSADKLLVFTNNGKYIYIPAHELIESKFKDIGKHINDKATISPETKIVKVIAVSNFETKANIVVATSGGKIKRVNLEDFKVSRYSKALTTMKLSPMDKVVSVDISNGNNKIILISNSGKAVKYPETEISKYGTKSSGVKGIVLNEENKVSSMLVTNEEDTIALVSNRGGIKRINVSNISDSSKWTQGKQIYKVIKGNPHIVIDSSKVTTKDYVYFFENNKIKEIKLSDINLTQVDQGFSLTESNEIIDAKIMSFKTLKIDDEYFKIKNNPLDEDKIIDEVEKKISQISIDDLLKNIK